jgi:hypothetical protein
MGINNAQDLVNQLNSIAETHGVELKDLEVNFRQNFNSDVHKANWVCEDLYEPHVERLEILRSVVIYNDREEEDEEI